MRKSSPQIFFFSELYLVKKRSLLCSVSHLHFTEKKNRLREMQCAAQSQHGRLQTLTCWDFCALLSKPSLVSVRGRRFINHPSGAFHSQLFLTYTKCFLHVSGDVLGKGCNNLPSFVASVSLFFAPNMSLIRCTNYQLTFYLILENNV